MNIPKQIPYNFRYSDIFLGCYFTDHLIEHYKDYLTGDLKKLVSEIELLRNEVENIDINKRFYLEFNHSFKSIVSICAAQMEGSSISSVEYIKAKLDKGKFQNKAIREIENIEKAINYINNKNWDHGVDKDFISKLYRIVTDKLEVASFNNWDYDLNANGEYRKTNPDLSTHLHLPPHWEEVEGYMEQLINFINEENEPQYDFIKAAVAQHRFIWICPFDRANEKLSRLLSYAVIIKNNVKRKNHSMITTAALVMCKNRHLSMSETEQSFDNGIVAWLESVFKEIKEDIKKIGMLTDYDFLEKQLLKPAIARGLEKKYLTEKQSLVLLKAVEKQVIQASDVKEVYPYKSDTEISREIKKMIDKKLLVKEFIGTRKYVLSLQDNCVLMEMLYILKESGFIKV